MPPKTMASKKQPIVILFTGGLSSMTRDAAKKLVEKAGWKSENNFNKRVTVLVSNTDKDTHKLEKAKENNNVMIWSEEEFLAALSFAGVDVGKNKSETKTKSRSPSPKPKSRSPSPKPKPRSPSPKTKARSPSPKKRQQNGKKTNARNVKSTPSPRSRSQSKSPAPPTARAKSPLPTKAVTKKDCDDACSNAITYLTHALVQLDICTEKECPGCTKAKTMIDQAKHALLECCAEPKKLHSPKAGTATASSSPKATRGRGRPKKS